MNAILRAMLPLPALLLVAAIPPLPAPPPPQPPAHPGALPDDQAAFRAHVMFLASDAMKGREAGTPEYDIAAQYVAAQFYAAGLKPAGDKGDYLQQVPLIGYKPTDRGDFVLTVPGGGSTPLAFGTDYIPAANPADAQTGRRVPDHPGADERAPSVEIGQDGERLPHMPSSSGNPPYTTAAMSPRLHS